MPDDREGELPPSGRELPELPPPKSPGVDPREGDAVPEEDPRVPPLYSGAGGAEFERTDEFPEDDAGVFERTLALPEELDPGGGETW